MEPTPEQLAAIERLHDNESLTDNLTDAAAKAVLNLAEQQILAGTPNEVVVAAVRAANKTGTDSPEIALASARAALPASAAVASEPQAKRKRARAEVEGAAAAVAATPPDPNPAPPQPPAPTTPETLKRPTPWDQVRRWFTGK